MLEDPSVRVRAEAAAPRASLILAAHESPNGYTEVWMGGAHSHHGEELVPGALANAWVIDCAGDIPPGYREVTGRWIACVFPDLDGPLATSNRVAHAASEAAGIAREPAAAAPERIYVMCQHGMNRSGLVTGLILRQLGLPPRETIDRIRRARPGALANDHFRLMLLAE
jgi:hypothetical protein